MSKHILLMEGPDAKGLIFHVTSVLYKNECNIFKQDEYVSPNGWFYMRTEFESTNGYEPEKVLLDLRKVIPNEEIKFKLHQQKKKDIVLLCTKEHHCLSEILIRYAFEELNANVLAVVSNYNSLQPFVGKFGIPFHYISAEDKSREEHEEAVLKTLDIYKPEFLVLAKYMRILSPGFVSNYSNRIINIHHSFLPAFIGANPYKQAYERGVKIIGATAHFVNDNLDEGPIIAQDTKEVDHRYSAQDMARDGRDVEKMVLIKALKLVLDDRVFIFGNRTVIL
ncbi:MAG: formyltetrahydrofolate deformylase [Cytophagaceae bacterium]|nr:formyltetrahydrofolate deformylase [Cytophagaceae bacterium]MBK9509431.1 formyltetrahydrofolate deformylase [Cytophagaceae bacterium]MBK9935142.1 formyltetrahydrofolate deformylase [Cytophagaceae bacterium]MBL0301586.1 formyltetrahydrofolate deformylase [Cytophagaceae bacterium]MBL0324410.1 formyltetrahydrofolate deformylase [Cytophagaceae bacterium]